MLGLAFVMSSQIIPRIGLKTSCIRAEGWVRAAFGSWRHGPMQRAAPAAACRCPFSEVTQVSLKAPRFVFPITRVLMFPLLAIAMCASITSGVARAVDPLTLSATWASPTSTWLKAPQDVLKDGRPAEFDVLVKAPHGVKIVTDLIMINLRNAKDEALTTSFVRNAVITSTGLRLRASRQLPPGDYRYRVGYQKAGIWYNIGSVHIFRVPDRTPQPITRQRWVMGYYVGYLKDLYPLDSVSWDALTHIVVGAVTPRDDGRIDESFFVDARSGPSWARAVVNRAHERGRKAILMVGGASTRSSFASATSPSNRARFISELIRIVDSYGFDGIDIDWEPITSADAPTLISIGQQLKASRRGLLLTLPVSPVNINLPGETPLSAMAGLSAVYDQINVMTYGMNGGYTGWASWHDGAIYDESPTTPMSVDSSIRVYRGAGVPAAKLGVGIGFFGSCATGATAPRQSQPAMKILGTDNTMSYSNVMRQYYDPAAVRWDDKAQAPYLSSTRPMGPLGCTYISYEDERSVAAKAEYIKANELGGAIIWNINEGHLASNPAGQQDPLLTTIRKNLLN